MKPSLFMRLRARRKAAGVAIITAIFLLVVVAGLGVAVVSMTTAQQDASAQDMQGLRAYQAAKAGVEWGLFQGLRGGGRPAFGCNAGGIAPIPVPLPNNSTLGFTITVRITCDGDIGGLAGGGDNDGTANHVVITSTACNQPANNLCPNPAPGPDYVQRVLRAQL